MNALNTNPPSTSWFYEPLTASQKAQLKDFELGFKRLYEAAKQLGKNLETIDRGALKKHKLALLKNFERLQNVFLKVLGNDEINQALLKAECERLKDQLNLSAPQLKFTAYLPHEIAAALHLNAASHAAIPFEEPLSPLSLQEARFIAQYLATDPCYMKMLTLYQLIQRKTESILTDFAKVHITIQQNCYTVYELSDTTYQFIGCSGAAEAVAEHYQGYLETQWPYICASLINENCPYFREENDNVFQVFSVPPEAIVHTAHFDLFTPCPFTAIPSHQKAWYALNRRSQVLAAYVNRLHYHWLVMKNEHSETGQLPLSTAIDQQLRLLQRAQQWVISLRQLNNRNTLIKTAQRLLLDVERRQKASEIKNFLTHLEASHILTPQELEDYSALLWQLHQLETRYPHFQDAQFAEKDGGLNRVKLQIQELINYYQKTTLDNAERMFHYQNLFAKDDPSSRWNILGELLALNEIANQFPSHIDKFRTRLNRMMGPYEILSETSRFEHNELNLDMRIAGGCMVKAFIVTKKLINSKAPEEIKTLVTILELAAKEKIPVLIRSYSK